MAESQKKAQPVSAEEVEANGVVAAGSDGAQVHPRGLVPSERQRARGADPASQVQVGVLREPKVPFRKQFREAVRSLDPRLVQPRLPWIVFLCVGLFADIDDQLLGVLGPLLRQEFGASVGQIILLGQLLKFVGLIIGLPIGYLVDRVNRVRLVQLGAIGGQIGSLLMPLAGTYTQLALLGTVGGLSKAIGRPAITPLMADYYSARLRARVFAFLGVGNRLFGLLILPLIGLAALKLSWRPTVFLLGVLALVVGSSTLLLKEPVRGVMDRLDMGVPLELATKAQPPMSWGESFRAAWGIRTLRRMFYADLFQAFTTPITVVLGFYVVEKFLLDPFEASILATVANVLTLPAILVSAAFADRLLADRPARVMTMYAAIRTLGALNIPLVLLAPNPWVMLPFGVVMSYITAIPALARRTIFSMIIPARVRGLGLELFDQIHYPLGILSTLLILQFQDRPLSFVLMAFLPFSIVAGLVTFTTATTVERDLRSARAAALASEESEKSLKEGQNKMIVCRDVDVEYDGVEVLFNVDFDVAEGETIALLGTNGAGKSTLLKAIAGIHQASNGAILLDGRDITHAPAFENAARGLVFMPGGHAIFPELTVAENLRTAAWMYKGEEEYVTQRMVEVLDLFPILKDRLEQQAATLSGGEQQMVALSQAFLMKPRLLMIDELSLGLAPQVVQQLLEVLEGIHAQGTTIILVEQSMNIAMTAAKRAVFMEKGRIQFDGPTEELLARPDLVRAVFMGGAAYAKTRPGKRLGTEREVLLEVKDVSVGFGGIQALSGVSLEVAAGEVTGIIGPNGAGKTTLFDVISGQQKPDSGTVQLLGEDLAGMSPDARARLGLGRSFQSARLFPSLTVRENIAVALERRAVKNPFHSAFWTPKGRRGERIVSTRAQGLIELFGLEPYAGKFVREISTGTRRAVEVACMVASEPKMLLLDEPSTGMAQAEIESLGPALSRIVRETGCGLLVIEHDIPLITSISDRLIAMELGTVIASGTPDEVRNDPRVVESYLAASDAVIQRSGSSLGSAMTTFKSDSEKQVAAAAAANRSDDGKD